MNSRDRDSILLHISEYPVAGGGYCDVYRSRLGDGTLVAVQRIRHSSNGKIQSMLNLQKKTNRIWAKLSHPNIVPLLGEVTVLENTATVYEWLQYGGVLEYLKHHPAADRYQLNAKICEGVAYLHTHGIIHGNLKGDQVYVSGDGVPRIMLPLNDTYIVDDEPDLPGYALRWTAPEVLESEDSKTFQSDVYSLGMTILETTTSSFPYAELQSDFAVIRRVMKQQYPSRPMDTIPDNERGNTLWRLLSACWSHNPKDRPSAMEVSKVMNSLGFGVYQDLKSTVKFTDETTVEDMAALLIQNGVVNYTAELQHRNLQLPHIMKLSAVFYRIEDFSIKRNDQRTLHTQTVIVKFVRAASPHKELKRATRESLVWSRCKHVNILPLLGFAVFHGSLAIISPLIENKSATEYVKKQQNPDYYGLCTQLSGAINYLHGNGVVHGDIKGDNVLVSNEGIVKVIDFGVSILAQLRIEFTQTGVGRGTERWQAPEILTRTTDSTKEADIYALSMTIIEIYTHDSPYGGADIGHNEKSKIIEGKLRPGRPYSFPFDRRGMAFWPLLERCWSVDPAARPTANEVYKQLARG